MRGKLKVGQKVRVKGQNRIAYIVRFQPDGTPKLDRMIQGFTLWRADDLVPKKERAR